MFHILNPCSAMFIIYIIYQYIMFVLRLVNACYIDKKKWNTILCLYYYVYIYISYKCYLVMILFNTYGRKRKNYSDNSTLGDVKSLLPECECKYFIFLAFKWYPRTYILNSLEIAYVTNTKVEMWGSEAVPTSFLSYPKNVYVGDEWHWNDLL